MKGIQFWNQHERTAVAFDPIVKNRLDTVRAWLADPRDKPVYELLMDGDTDVFVNGCQRQATALRPGDSVGVCHAGAGDASYSIRPFQVRAYRFPRLGTEQRRD
jgi:hypothetical protein